MVKYDATPVWAGCSFGNGANNQAFGMVSNDSGFLTVQGWGGGNDIVSTEPGVGAGWLVQSVIVNSDNVEHFKDGVSIDTGTQSYNTVLNKLVIGEEINNLGFVDIDVAGVYVFNRALTAGEHDQMVAYIQDKFFNVACDPCAITGLTVGAQSNCVTNTYDQELTVIYNNAPGTGMLDVNDQQFPITGSPQTVVLTGLNADGNPVDITAQFTDEPACQLVANGLYTAPNGCGGGTGCVIPTNGLVLHLETDMGISTSGSTVTGWADQSAQANDLTGAGDPQLVAAGLNGMDYIALDGTDDWLERTAAISGLPTGNGDRSMFAIIRYNNMATYAGAAFGNGAANEAFGLVVNGGGGNLTVQGWGGANDNVSATAGTGAGWLSQSVIFGDGNGEHFLNGGSIDTYTHVYNTVNNRISIGEEISGGGNGEEFDIAAVILYDRALSPTERQDVETYLQWKYLGGTGCASCTITDITAGAQSVCDPQTQTYSQDIIVTYSDAPATGFLEVNGQQFPITTSPQTVNLVGLAANAADVDVTAFFTDDVACTYTVNALYTAPAACGGQCVIPTNGLVLHLETDQGVATSGSTVTGWTDQSVQANDLTAFGDPQLVAAGLNGMDYIEMDGTGDWLERTASINGLPTDNDDRSMFAVIRYNTMSTYAGAAFGAGSGNDAFGLVVNGGSGNLTVQGWGGGNDYVSATAGTGAGWLSQSVIFGGGNGEQFKDGVSIDTYTHSYTTGNSRIVLGEEIAGAGDGEVMDIAAVLVYDRALTEIERQEVETYLQWKYLGGSGCVTCAITGIAAGAQSNCNSGTYDQDITVTYNDPPTTGFLEVNGQQFPITTSPQTVNLVGLTVDGLPVDVTAFFTDEPSCTLTESALYTAPDHCGPKVELWYGDTIPYGNNGEPQVWCNIPGNVLDADGGTIDLFEYTLNGSSPVTLSIGPDNRRLVNSGDFNIDIAVSDLVSGSNEVVITAENNNGHESKDTVIVNYTPGNIWPLNYSVDWSALNDESDVNEVAHVVDGKWMLTPDGIRTEEPGYDRLIGIGDKLWTNYEVLVPITIHDMPSGAGVGVLMRWKGHTDTPVVCPQPKCGYLPLGDIAWYRPNELEFYEGGNISRTIPNDVTQMFRVSVETDISGQTTYRMKVWEQGTMEPVAWDLTKTTGPTDEQEGCLLLITHKADVTFGNVVVTPGSLNISNVQVQLGNGNTEATITWNTNQPASSTIEYGPSSAYEDGTVSDPALVTSHSLMLTGLTPNSIYHYQISGENAAMELASTGDLIFSTYTSGIVSDDFCSGVLDPVWTFEDPLADGSYQLTGAGTSDAWVEISVPSGSDHEVYTSGINVPVITQSVSNADFEVEVKFESPVSTPQYQEQGILVRESANKYLRFDFYSKDPDNTMIYAQAFDLPATEPAAINTSISTANTFPLYMRVKRQGDQWTQTYSLDSTNWLPGASFTYSITPTAIGPYAGNATGASSPAHTAQIDYFMNLADPISNEDACSAMQSPIIAPISDQLLEEDESQVVNITATDPDGNDADLVFTSIGLPAFAQLMDNGDGTAQLDLDPLSGDAGAYPISIIATDLDLLADTVEFTVTVTLPGGTVYDAISDDFCSGVLAPHWSFVDPQADGTMQLTGAMTNDAWLEISVPAGPEHQLWTSGIQAPHIIQNANDSDLVFTVKFESPVVSPQYQEQGMLLKENNFNFLRFEIYSTNSNTNILAATLLSPGNTLPLASNIPINTTVGPLGTAPIFMRVERSGDLWTQSYSLDSTNWTVAGSFTQALDLTEVGLYGGNATGSSSPAHTAQFDYFESADNPITNEDGCPYCEITSITAGITSSCDPGTQTYSQEITVTYEDEPTTGMLDVNGQQFVITASPQTVTLVGLTADGLPVDVTASFTDNPTCTNTENALFTAALPCTSCPLPSDGLVLHLEGDQGVSTTGSTVDTWADQSGQGNDLTSNGDPQLVAAGLNGYDYIELDGSDDWLDRAAAISGLPAGSSDRSMFAVIRYNNMSSYAGASFGNGSANEAFGLVVDGGGGDLTVQGWGGGNDQISATPGTGAGWLSQSVILSSNNGEHFLNGGSIDTYTHMYETVNNRIAIGEEIGGIGNGEEMDIAAVLVYDRALTELERQAVETYLQWKYFGGTACVACEITDLTAGVQTPCDNNTNLYTQEVIVDYVGDPGFGMLDVNGQLFPITGSPQTVTLTGLNSDGFPVDVTAQFTGDTDCNITEISLFNAPAQCSDCLVVPSGLVLHLESDQGFVMDADTVLQWQDASPADNDMMNGGQPVLAPAQTPTGMPAVDFDGIDDKLERTAALNGLPAGGSDRTVFMVAKYNGNGFAGFAYGTGDCTGGCTCNNAFGLIVSPSGNLMVQGWCDDFDSGVNGNGAGWLVQSAVLEDDYLRHFKDGIQIDAQSHVFNTILNNMVVGAEIDSDPYIDMEVAAILIYDRALTSAEYQAVEQYLEVKYLGGYLRSDMRHNFNNRRCPNTV